MSELKTGSTAVYEIGGEKLKVSPMPWGKLKKVLKLFSESWGNFDPKMIQDTPKFMKWLVEMIGARMDDMFPLLVDEKLNPFFNQQWVEENLTLQDIQQIVTDAITVNGVKDFLALTGRKSNPSPLPEEAKVEEPVTA